MKNIHYAILFSLFFSLNFNQNVQAQCSVNIFGTDFLCPGEIGELIAEPSNGFASYVWTTTSGTILTGSTTPNIVIGGPGDYCLVAITQDSCVAEACFFVEESPFLFINIDGPNCFYPGSDLVFVAVDNGGGQGFNYQWTGPNGLSSNEQTLFIPNADESMAGTYCVEVFDFNGCSSFTCIDVGTIPQPEILNASFFTCVDPDSITIQICDKVCANTEATYELDGVSSLASVDWAITGAESFQTNGTQVTVQWGEPGAGNVSAVVQDLEFDPPLQLFCGHYEILDIQFPVSGYVTIDGGSAPYNITVLIDGNLIYNGSGFPGMNVFPSDTGGNPFGTYEITVTDANGNTEVCIIPPLNNNCFLSASPEIQHPDGGNCCNGSIDLTGISPFPIIEYSWSNGAIGPSISNLCAGTYSVTVVDEFNCTFTTSIQLICPNFNNCTASAELCVDIIEEPEALFSTTPDPVNGVVEICQGQTVFFENLSTNAESYIWDFGDFTTSVQFSPEHTFFNPGLHTVALIARNECFCSDTTFLSVNVLDGDVPEINCVGTVCEGSSTTYTAEDVCGTYDWTVSANGTVTDGGGISDDFVTVLWQTGDLGTVSLEVTGCGGVICNLPNVQEIHIISDNATIEGVANVCQEAIEEYTITNFGGTDFIWSISSGGTIVDGWNTNQITVFWQAQAQLGGNPQWVMVEYENCYLDCSGDDLLNVNIVPEYFIEGPIQVCQNDAITYQTKNTINQGVINANWEILDNTGTSIWTAANIGNPNITWNFPVGKYTLIANPSNPNDFCNSDYSITVEILELPPAPSAINGEDEICPGTFYTYEAVGLPEHGFRWTVNDGGTITEVEGNPINVAFGASQPYELSVIQIAPTGLQCESSPTTFEAFPIPSFSIAGNSNFCREETGFFNTSIFENVDYEWSVIPEDRGTVIAGQGMPNVEILWHSGGVATVRVDICGGMSVFNVNVFDLPLPKVLHPDALCPGETATIQTIAPFQSYEWKDADGILLSTSATPDLGPGEYEVEVTDINDCKGSAFFEILPNPIPTISISTPSYMGLCPGGPSVNLYALNTDEGYTYQWYQNGSIIPGAVNAIHNTNQIGSYFVEVTNQFNCSNTSNVINLVDCESIGGTCVNGFCLPDGVAPPPGCVPDGSLDFDIQLTPDCATHDFVNTSVNAVPGSFSWNFGDPASGNNSSNLDNPSHTFTLPGFYTVIMYGLVNASVPVGGTCYMGTFKDDLIPAVADFESETSCPGEIAQFTDLSTFVPISGITNWDWDFGDPASGADNVSTDVHPTHIYNIPGNYQVTLTITAVEGCQSSITKTVVVDPLPSIMFQVPDETCESNALNFIANVSNDVTEVTWDFGDPASGDANTSELFNTHHAFESAGLYTVTVTAVNVLGCMETFSDVVMVEPNDLVGTINFSQPSPICEGDSITLTAPPGGISWVWSNGAGTESILVKTAGVYEVTVTDDEGCTYSPPAAVVDVFPLPNGVIQAIELNEFGQPVAFFNDMYEVCEGEDVVLVVHGDLNYSYTWSDGTVGVLVEYTEVHSTLLSTGTHEFYVNITNTATGCSNEEGPFIVEVHPVPTNVTIVANPAGVLCENSSAMLSVQNPDASLTYVWNTGEMGTSITVVAGGEYYVRAVNQFGCEGESNHLTIQNAPDINKIPSGCHVRCKPDTICLPFIPNVISYQWYFNGMLIPAPEGTVADYIALESGDYHVELMDFYGCTATSGTISLELLDGFGSISGQVYFDLNENEIIDGGDTLMADIPILLVENNIVIASTTTNQNGDYYFSNVPSTNYLIQVDTLNLPQGLAAILAEAAINLFGCDDEGSAEFLIHEPCQSSSFTLEPLACAGDSLQINGIFIQAGETEIFNLTNSMGCDSTLIVNVIELPTGAESVNLTACENGTVDYDGTSLSPGDVQDFTFQNINGCDSVVTVSVSSIPNGSSDLALVACENGTVDYDGMSLSPGDVQDFTFQNVSGCDSVVTVTVSSIPNGSSDLSLIACENGTVDYDGMSLSPGDVQDFTFQNVNGCDSVVTVTVSVNPSDASDLALTACENGTVDYDGTSLSPGDVQDFTFQNINGCDSVVTVTVSTIPSDASDLALEACENGTVDYDGMSLSPGDVQAFTLQNVNGCDSVVTVTVSAYPSEASNLALEACENGTVNYNGQSFSPGDMVDVTLQNVMGCDSVVTVSVSAYPPDASNLQLEACENSFVEYEGQFLFPGDMQAFTLQNVMGCDSVVTVFVETLTIDTESLMLQACDGNPAIYNGNALEIGSTTDFVFQNMNGCDSIVQVNVEAFPEVDFDVSTAEVCSNSFDGMIEVYNITGSTAPYEFSIDGVTFQNNPEIENLSGGSYTVLLQDAAGCIYTNNIEIPITPPIQIALEDVELPCGSNGVALQPNIISGNPTNLTWAWSNGDTQISTVADTAGIYQVTVGNDCESVQQEVAVTWGDAGAFSRLYIPNVFSPNGDGINDQYVVLAGEEVTPSKFDLKIFDRWGDMMFQTDEITLGWDGRLEGKKLRPQVFVYWIEIEMEVCGQVITRFQKGDILLLK